jgi:hypothetical protein
MRLINIDNANYSLSLTQLCYELSQDPTIHLRPPTDLYQYIAGQLPTGCRQNSDVSVGCVDVRLQYFVLYTISVNINCFPLPRCCSLFWHYKWKKAALARLCVRGKPKVPVHLSKKCDALCWKWESPTNQTLQLPYVISVMHSELTHTLGTLGQLCCSLIQWQFHSTIKFYFLLLNRNAVLRVHYSNTLQQHITATHCSNTLQ